MIFPLLLADVLLLKFHYLLWQVDLFRELDCKNLFLVACPASRSSPLLPPSLLLALSQARSSSRFPAEGQGKNEVKVQAITVETFAL